LHGSVFLEPIERLLKNLGCTDVRWHDDPIVHPRPFPPCRNDTCTSEISQMPTDLGLVSLKNFNEETNAHFILTHEMKQPKTGSVGQGAKE